MEVSQVTDHQPHLSLAQPGVEISVKILASHKNILLTSKQLHEYSVMFIILTVNLIYKMTLLAVLK